MLNVTQHDKSLSHSRFVIADSVVMESESRPERRGECSSWLQCSRDTLEVITALIWMLTGPSLCPLCFFTEPNSCGIMLPQLWFEIAFWHSRSKRGMKGMMYYTRALASSVMYNIRVRQWNGPSSVIPVIWWLISASARRVRSSWTFLVPVPLPWVSC